MIYLLTSFLAPIFALGIGLFVYLGKKTSIHKYFFLLSLSLFFWLFGCFGETLAKNRDIALVFDKMLYTGIILYPLIFYYFIHSFLNIKIESRSKSIIFMRVFAGVLLVINYIDNLRFLFIRDVAKSYPFRFIANPGVLWFCLVVFVSSVVTYGLILLLKELTKSSGSRLYQIRYLFIAFLILTVAGIMYFGLVINIYTPPIDNLLVDIALVIIAYAILKHRLLDVRLVLTRGAILLIVYICIVGIPLLVTFIGKEWLVKYLQTKWFVPPLGLYTILALLGPYIYLTFQNKAEEKRMRQQVRLHQSLKAASKTTIEVQSIDKLSKIIPRYLLKLYRKLDNKIMHISMFLHDKDNKVYHMQSSVGEHKIPVDTLIREDSMLVKWFTVIRDRLVDEGVMRANDVEVLVYEDIEYWLSNPNVLRKPFKGLDKVLRQLKKTMELYKASIILPSVYQKELLGFLMLGEKTPDPYSISDISTFSILANDSAMAFKAAQLFEDLKVAQTRLIQSEKLNLLGQLASSMAHEINNPLAIISGNVQLLLMDETDESKKKFLQKISDQTERGYKIIHRLLNFSRLPKEEIKVIKVHEMIDETLELIGHKIKHSNIELIKEYNQVPEINGNPTQIQEVLLNLFVNGIQSMGEGGTLKITTAEVKHKVEVMITDTGKGIEEKDIQNIFDPFYTKGKENGTGLGLFVASQVMGLHKGTINVKSKVGQGTTFVLQFGLEKN